MLSRTLFRVVATATALVSTFSIASADSDRGRGRHHQGVVFTATNAPDGNRIIAYDRQPNGHLSYASSFATGGLGTGSGLGNQGGIILSDDWLLAVNAGSNEVSVFELFGDLLVLRDVVSSGGATPISVTVNHELVYVLNAGDPTTPANITGFALSDEGRLTPLAGSTRPLSAADVGPAQIGFNPWGSVLMVTEKGTNMIDTYTVGDDGLASAPIVQPSNGETPFGFAFDRWGRVLVSEAFGGAPDISTVSSYSIDCDTGLLTTLAASVPTLQTAACWVAIDKSSRHAYTTNTGSSSLTGFWIGNDGSLIRLDDDGVTAETGAGTKPIDMAFSEDGHFLYSLNGGATSITGFRVRHNGSLQLVETELEIPDGANGLAAR